MVQANFDVGSVIQIGEPTSRALHIRTKDLFTVSSDKPRFSHHHYVSVLGIPDPIAAGSTISVTVRNLMARTASSPLRRTPPRSTATATDSSIPGRPEVSMPTATAPSISTCLGSEHHRIEEICSSRLM